jgi:Chromo (CHRromatin Organisation MOdifier) domain
MLNAKNIRTKRPSKKLAPKLYGPFKILEQHGNLAYKPELSNGWKIHLVFQVSLLEPYRTSIRPGREQPPMQPEEIDGDLEWEVEKIIKSEIISYERRVRRQLKTFKELRYFVKWKGCSEDENTWEPPEHLEQAQEMVEIFHRENPDMPRLG